MLFYTPGMLPGRVEEWRVPLHLQCRLQRVFVDVVLQVRGGG